MDYQDIIDYWNALFSNIKDYEITKPIPYAQIENALRWLCEDSTSILDFGCGNGKILFRCLNLGVKNICGIDISKTAIDIAKKTIAKYNLNNGQFIYGSIKELDSFSESQFDGVILFNIIDNLIPGDGFKVIKQVHKLTKVKSKILIKLNEYIPEEQIKNNPDLFLIDKNFYKEKSGLFLWNLSDHDLEKIVSPYFAITNYEEVEFENNCVKNRIFYLIRKSNTK